MYNILLTTDENFAQHCGVCVASLLTNNPDAVFNIVVAGIELSQPTKSNLEACAGAFQNGTLKVVDFSEEKLEEFPQIGHYEKNIYLRLWVEEFFDQGVDRVLYLDADTIVVDSIEHLFEVLMDDFVLGAVDIPFSDSHKRCHLPEEYGYFNSGVILFDVQRWKNEECRSKIKDFLIENREIALNPDQDALNGVLYKQRLSLDYTYNAISPFFRDHGFKQMEESELVRVRENVKIVHFNGRARPWIYSSNHPYQSAYFKYLRQTPWRNFRPEDKSLLTFIKKKLRIYLKKESFVSLTTLKGL